MLTAKLNLKGQITIPRRLRQELGLRSGDELELIIKNQALVATPKERRIEAAFGIYAATRSVSVEMMETVIRERGMLAFNPEGV